jgi:hypothetical protein
VDTSKSKVSGDLCVAPDISVYCNDHPASNQNLFHASDLDCFLELKHTPLHDPFDDEAEELERHSGYARDTRGQIATYLTAMQVSQYRTHSFGVVIVGATCRLLRHTQSGTEIIPSFDYTTTAHLQTFFWRLSHASPPQHGVDTTFLPVGREFEDRAKICTRSASAIGPSLSPLCSLIPTSNQWVAARAASSPSTPRHTRSAF